MNRRKFIKGLLAVTGLGAAGGIASAPKQFVGFDPAKPDSEETEVFIGRYEGVSIVKTDEAGNIVEKEFIGDSIVSHPTNLWNQKALNKWYRGFVDNAQS